MQGGGSSIGLYSVGSRSECTVFRVEGLSGTTRVLRWERMINFVAEGGLVSNVNAERQYLPLVKCTKVSQRRFVLQKILFSESEYVRELSMSLFRPF